jgi:uncharacterized protein YjiS (DUF1127 family)
MTTISKQTRRLANWLSRSHLPQEVTTFSDRALRDVGLCRYRLAFEDCKPFWMA